MQKRRPGDPFRVVGAHVPIDTRPACPDDKPGYQRKALSNREGFRRLDKSLEKLELRGKTLEKVCDVCGRRCRAWRIVPALFGQQLRGTTMRGRFVLACDKANDGDSCAATLLRAGVDKEAVSVQARMDALGLERAS